LKNARVLGHRIWSLSIIRALPSKLLMMHMRKYTFHIQSLHFAGPTQICSTSLSSSRPLGIDWQKQCGKMATLLLSIEPAADSKNWYFMITWRTTEKARITPFKESGLLHWAFTQRPGLPLATDKRWTNSGCVCNRREVVNMRRICDSSDAVIGHKQKHIQWKTLPCRKRKE
jgi:hypothetical protein